MKKIIYPSLLLLFATFSFKTIAQESYWAKPDSLFKFIQPNASMQLWSAYSMNEKAQLTTNGPLEPVQDRLDFLVRRARIGFKGRPYKSINYVLNIQFDNLGKDKYSAVRGSTNAGTLGILDAYMTWRITENELFNATVGFFQPQYSRECITGDLLVNSLDKSVSQSYVRQHITGKSYGRTTGINLGGLKKSNLLTFEYNVGLYDNNSTSSEAETSGIAWSPLTVERLAVTIGDAEKKSYSINYGVNNYFNKRNGITFGGYSSQQNKSDLFSSNFSAGIDMLFNFKNLNLDGEWNWLQRTREGETFKAQTGHIRAGYNVIIANKYFIEPTFMVTQFNGQDGYAANGEDRLYDIGVNWYLNKKSSKLSLHYILQEGHGVNGYTNGTTFQKGNYGALAYVIIF